MSLRVGGRRSSYAIIGLTLAAMLAVWLPAPYAARLVGAILLAFFLPGWTLIHTIGLEIRDVLERLVLAVGMSYAAMVLVSLIVLYREGQVAAAPIIGVLGLGSLALAAAGIGQDRQTGRWGIRLSRRDLLYICLCGGVAAFFAFANLGYADYWGDEMNGLLRAISVIGGRPESIFEHTKGPVEILIPATFGLLVGQFDPFTLRLPFALAHVAGIGAFYLLVRRMFSQNVALLAAALLAINGLYLAFGRIVQYQTVVFLATVLSILMAYRFCQRGEARYLGVSALLTGVGLLAHYDVLLTLPVIGYLVWQRYVHYRTEWKAKWYRLAIAGAMLLLVVALFYLPFVLRPHLAETSPYLARRIGGTTWPANNTDELYVFAVLYNSAYYVAFIALLGVVKLLSDLVRMFRSRQPLLGRAAGALMGGAILLSLIAVLLGRVELAPLFVCSLAFILLIGFAPVGAETRAIYIWFAISFVGYVFLVDHPRTHLRVIYAPWLVLAALMVSELASLQSALARWVRRPVLPGDGAMATVTSTHRRLFGSRKYNLGTPHATTGDYRRLRFLHARWTTVGMVGVLCLLFLLFAGYQYLLFVDTQAEYVFTYPEHKSRLYWEDPLFPFGSRRLYGVPHRLGWQMINQLYLEGVLQGDWDSNDYGSNLFWYALGRPRNPCYPRYYFAAQFLQKGETDAATAAFPLTKYARIGQIWNRDRLQIDVYEFAPLGGAGEMSVWSEPLHYDLAIAQGDFRSLPYEEPAPVISTPLPTQAVFRPSSAALQTIAGHYGDPRITSVRDKVALLGYSLDEQWARPGGVIVLTLYWQAVDTVNLPYKIFVHLEEQGALEATPKTWAQSDTLPACGTRSTQRWKLGEIVTDRHMIDLPPDIPAGDYALGVGLYESQTQQRMDVLDVMGNPQGTRLDLAHVRVLAAE